MIENVRRIVLLVAVIFPLTCCGSPSKPAPEPTRPFISIPAVSPLPPASPSPPAPRRVTSPQPSPSLPVRRVGEFCFVLHQKGVTATGRPLVCDHSHSETVLRWRYAS